MEKSNCRWEKRVCRGWSTFGNFYVLNFPRISMITLSRRVLKRYMGGPNSVRWPVPEAQWMRRYLSPSPTGKNCEADRFFKKLWKFRIVRVNYILKHSQIMHISHKIDSNSKGTSQCGSFFYLKERMKPANFFVVRVFLTWYPESVAKFSKISETANLAHSILPSFSQFLLH